MQSIFLGRLGTPGIEIEYSPNLESMLSLPYGWTYRSRFLTEDLVIDGNQWIDTRLARQSSQFIFSNG